eukprot:gene10090-7060_t
MRIGPSRKKRRKGRGPDGGLHVSPLRKGKKNTRRKGESEGERNRNTLEAREHHGTPCTYHVLLESRKRGAVHTRYGFWCCTFIGELLLLFPQFLRQQTREDSEVVWPQGKKKMREWKQPRCAGRNQISNPIVR